jgi:hypothetical protein
MPEQFASMCMLLVANLCCFTAAVASQHFGGCERLALSDDLGFVRCLAPTRSESKGWNRQSVNPYGAGNCRAVDYLTSKRWNLELTILMACGCRQCRA